MTVTMNSTLLKEQSLTQRAFKEYIFLIKIILEFFKGPFKSYYLAFTTNIPNSHIRKLTK